MRKAIAVTDEEFLLSSSSRPTTPREYSSALVKGSRVDDDASVYIYHGEFAPPIEKIQAMTRKDLHPTFDEGSQEQWDYDAGLYLKEYGSTAYLIRELMSSSSGGIAHKTYMSREGISLKAYDAVVQKDRKPGKCKVTFTDDRGKQHRLMNVSGEDLMPPEKFHNSRWRSEPSYSSI